MNSLQQMAHEMRDMEATKQGGFYHMAGGTSIGDGTLVITESHEVCYGETVGDEILAIKESTEVCTTGSIDAGTAEDWRA